jgi:ABC-type nitrate/sulfonate/bicarbonate transport system permease component
MNAGRRLVRISGLVLAIGLWYLAAEQAHSPYFPRLSRIYTAFKKNWLFDRVLSDVVPSLRNLAFGFLIAVVVGTVGGVILGLLPGLYRAFTPILEFLRAMPPPVFLSFGLLLLGIGTPMRVAVIALGPVWPVLLNTVDGVRNTEPGRLDMARVFGFSRIGVLTRIVLPSAAPRIMAGLRVGLPLALVLMVISELIGSTEGLGYFIEQSSLSYRIADMWSAIVLLGLLGWALSAAMLLVERFVLRGRAPAIVDRTPARQPNRRARGKEPVDV